MIVLLIVVSIGVIVYGYLLMGRLDRFFARGGFSREPEAAPRKEILLFGQRNAVDDICRVLDREAILYDRTGDTVVNERTEYHWVGAFSNDDADNLLLCLSARNQNPAIRTMARCNDGIYENIFRKAGVTVILQRDIPVAQILDCLRRERN